MKKLLYFLLLSFCIVVIFSYHIASDRGSLTKTGEKDNPLSSNPVDGTDDAEVEVRTYFSADYFIPEDKNPQGDIIAVEDLDGIGYHLQDEAMVYQSYSLEVLETLLFSGDTRAYFPLLDKYTASDDIDRLIPASHVAAIHGSTPAIHVLAGQESNLSDIALTMDDPVSAKEHLVMSCALYRLASLLGDPYAEQAMHLAIDRFDAFEIEEEQLAIELLAVRLRNELNTIRQSKGLHDL